MRKLILATLVTGPLAILPGSLWGLASNQAALDLQVNSKSSGVTITSVSANLVNVSATATNSVITWNNFGDDAANAIGSLDAVSFSLPSSSSAILNRVIGSTTTTIFGTLNSNGKIFIVNPNGVVVGATGLINAAAIGLSTVNEPDGSFLLNGDLSYVGTASTKVETYGRLVTSDGKGSVYLAGKGVNVGANSNNAAAGATIAGNLTIDSQGGLVQLGVGNSGLKVGADNTTGTLLAPVGGDITIKSKGGDVDIANSQGVTAWGNLSIDTTGALVNGRVFQTSNNTVSVDEIVGTTVNSNSKGITIVTGGNALPAGDITTRKIDSNWIAVTGNNVTIVDTDFLQIKNSTVSGNLTVQDTATGNTTTTASGTTIDNNISMASGATITMTTANSVVNTDHANKDRGVTLNITNSAGDLYLGQLNTAPNRGTANITASGNIVIGQNVDIPTLVLKSTGGNVTQAAGTTIVNSNSATRGATVSVTANGDTSVVTLANVGNNFSTVTLNDIKGGATIADDTGLTLSGTVNGPISVSANLNAPATYTVVGATTSTNSGTTVGGTFSNINLPTLYTAIGAPAPVVVITPMGGAGNPDVPAQIAVTYDAATGKASFAFAKDLSDNNIVGSGYTWATPTTTGKYYAVSVAGATEATTITKLVANSTLTVNGGQGPIITGGDANTVYGNVTLTTAGKQVMLTNGSSQYGQVNIDTTAAGTVPTGAAAWVTERTTLNLGAINTGSAATSYLKAISKEGNIVNTAQLKVGGDLIVGAGSAVAPGDINVDYSDATLGVYNQIVGNITLEDSVTALYGTTPNTSGIVGDYLANNVTIVNGVNTNLAKILNTSSQGLAGNLSLTAAGTASSLNLPNTLSVAGNLSLSATGGVTASDTSNRISGVTITAGDDVNIFSRNSLTISGLNLTENLSGGSTAAFRSYGSITFSGANNSTFTGLLSFQTGSGTTYRAITDEAGATLSFYGPVYFNSNDAVTIDNLGHNFGGIKARAGNDRSITIVESGTMKVLDVNANGKGNITLTSTAGDIIVNTAATAATDGIDWAGVRLGNNDDDAGLGKSTITFNAKQGAVVINDSGAKNNFYRSKVVVDALNASTIVQSTNNLYLGNVTVREGGLTVQTGGKNLAQSSSTKINVYGDVALNSGAGTITLDNTGNRFGALLIDTANKDVIVRENTTINLKHVATGTGALTLTSETGDIIDTADANLALLLPPVANTVVVGGAATLSAAKGAIELDLAGNDFGTVTFTSLGNTKIVDSLANGLIGLTMGVGSNVGGTLDITALAGNIYDNGTITAAGNTTFTASAGDIYVLDNSNRFGALRFSGTNVTIVENTTLNLRGGSIATGAVNLTTFGDFVTSGVGGSSFTGSGLTVNATGKITPGAGSLLVIGTLTVNSPSTKDLSALSLSGNLVNKTPINLGTGAYVPPSP